MSSRFKRKLTPRQAREMAADRARGWSQKKLAEKYGISVRTVRLYLAGHEYGGKRSHYNKRELKPCGTNAAWWRHKQAGEYPCTACIEAHNAATQVYKQRRRERLQREAEQSDR